MLQRLLDAFATRTGTVLTVGLGCAVCLAAGVFFQLGANRVLATHETFRQFQLRDSFVTMSDMSRLVLVIDQIAVNGEMTPELAEDLMSALDILYVRAASIKTREVGLELASGNQAPSAAIYELVEFVDAALETGLVDLPSFKASLLDRVDAIRGKLVVFLDSGRRLEDRLLDQQAIEVQRQARIVGTVFFTLALFMTSALLLLRKEVSARQARARAERRADYLAFFDPLTGLPNRVQFTDHVQERLDRNLVTSVLLIDIDGFKQINDTHGHAAGDVVLRAVGERIALAIEAQDGVGARLSGDEFAICMPTDDMETLEFYADSILSAMRLPVQFEAETFEPQGSAGIATSTQVARYMDLTYSNLMRAGDFALFASKERGKDTITTYDDALEVRFSERRDLVKDLLFAITHHGLEVYLQPKVILPEGRPYGFEALVRWSRNGREISPDIFISLAEEAGLVTEIDLFVLRHATCLIAERNLRHGTDFSVSVNLSALHFNATTIASDVAGALSTAKLPPHLLTLEVTETVQIQDWDRVRFVLSQLGDLGCRISIDDFGSGYSSLAYLRNMVADEIKVDRSLLDGIATSDESQHVLKAIVELSAGLGMDVLVEGIEDLEQSEIVQSVGCDRAQGFLFGKPQAAHDAVDAALARLQTLQGQAV